jgi:hypothetical protein
MTIDSPELTQLRRYFLGQLGDAEQRSVQERILRDDQFDELAELAAEELCIDWVGGRLNAEHESTVASLIATPEWRERAGFARVLTEQVREHTGDSPGAAADRASLTTARKTGRIGLRGVGNPIAIAASIIAVATSGLWLNQRRQTKSLGTLATALGRRVDSVTSSLESARARQNTLELALRDRGTTDILLETTNRSEMSSMVLASQVSFVRLRLLLPQAVGGGPYVVRIALEGGAPVFSRMVADSEVDRTTRTLVVVVPTAVLQERAYTIELLRRSGGAPDQLLAAYGFSVVSR